MTTFNTNLTAHSLTLFKPWAALLRLLTRLMRRHTVDPEQALAKAERREAARRSVDNLLR